MHSNQSRIRGQAKFRESIDLFSNSPALLEEDHPLVAESQAMMGK